MTSWEGQPGVTGPSLVVIQFSAVLPAPVDVPGPWGRACDLAVTTRPSQALSPWPTPQVGVLSEGSCPGRSPASLMEKGMLPLTTAYAQGKYTRPGASSAQGSDQ